MAVTAVGARLPSVATRLLRGSFGDTSPRQREGRSSGAGLAGGAGETRSLCWCGTMAIYNWMQAAEPQREKVRRSRGRRAADRLPSLESALVAAGILAWAWSAYQMLALALS